MKAERRHELEHNTLDNELAKTISFFRKHGNTIFWCIIIAAVLFMAVTFFQQRANRRHHAAEFEFEAALRDLSLTAEDRRARLEALTEQSTDRRIAAMASITLGDQELREVMLGRSLVPPTQAMGQAAEHYQRVVDRFRDFPILLAKAHVGLATVSENLTAFGRPAEFAQARQHYEAALAIEGAAGTPATDLAAQRMLSLPDLRKKAYLLPPTMQPSLAPPERAIVPDLLPELIP